MKPVFGIANSNAFDVATALKRLRPRTNVCVLAIDDISKVVDAKIIVAPSVQTVIRFEKELNESDALIFVIDIAVNLKRIRKIVMLDCRLDYNLGTQFYNLSDSMLEQCLTTKESYPFKSLKFTSLDVAKELLDKTPTSILSKIMTFLYSIPDKKKRELYKETIFHWLVNPDLSNDFLVLTLRLRGKGKRIVEFLSSDSIRVVRSMFAPGANPKALMRKHKISSFDYNYLKRVKAKTFKGKKKKQR